MGFVCCVESCANKSRQNKKGISFHSLPPKATVWRQQLLESLQLQDKDLEKWKTPKICSIHFPASDIRDVGCLKKLRKNALPTLILPRIRLENVEENQDKQCVENYQRNTLPEDNNDKQLGQFVFVSVEENRSKDQSDFFINEANEVLDVTQMMSEHNYCIPPNVVNNIMQNIGHVRTKDADKPRQKCHRRKVIRRTKRKKESEEINNSNVDIEIISKF